MSLPGRILMVHLAVSQQLTSSASVRHTLHLCWEEWLESTPKIEGIRGWIAVLAYVSSSYSQSLLDSASVWGREKGSVLLEKP